MKKQLFLCTMIALTFQNLSSFDNRKFFNIKTEEAQKSEISQWAYLEQTFIINVHEDKQVIWNHIYTALPAMFALYSGYKYWNLSKDSNANTSTSEDKTLYDFQFTGLTSASLTAPKDKKDEDILKNLLKTNNLYMIGGAIASAMFIKNTLDCYLNYYCNRHIVKSFLKNWEKNRSFTPREFHNTFDALANIMDINGDENVLEHANEIVNIMQSIIMRHFDKRYEKVLTVQTFNNLGETKNILDVLKSAVDTAKGLA